MGDRPCLIEFQTWFQASDYCNFWNYERWKRYEKYSEASIFVSDAETLSKCTDDISEMVNNTGFCQKDQNFM